MFAKALRFAMDAHKAQVRKYTGLPYIMHPIRVANRARDYFSKNSPEVVAALLHDTVEDCEVSLEEIEKEFSTEVRLVVWGLTSYSKQLRLEKTHRRAERKEIDRFFLSARGENVRILKLIDRIDNMLEIPAGESFANVYAEESQRLIDSIKFGLPDLLVSEAYSVLRGLNANKRIS